MRPNKPRRFRKAYVLAVTGALALAACSSSSSNSSTSGHPSTTTTKPVFNDAQFSGQPQIGGAIRFGVESSIATLDPAGNMAQPADIDTALAIYDPLVGYDDQGGYAPSLATKWTNSADLKTWSFTLRTGVQFSDGAPFNSEAVVKQFQRFKNPATNCTCAPQVAPITSVTAPDPTTVICKRR